MATTKRCGGALVAASLRLCPNGGDLLLLAFSTALTLPLVLQMLAHPLGLPWQLSPLGEAILATPVQFIVGWRFYRGAWKALHNLAGNMDLLVALGATAARVGRSRPRVRPSCSPW